MELEILAEPEDGRVANVDAVQESNKVGQREDWYDIEIELSDQQALFSLGGAYVGGY